MPWLNNAFFQIQWATKHGVPFVAQSGGHAWASWFKINSGGIVINMRKLNTVDIDTEKGLAVIGGGAVVQEVVDAAKSQKSHIGIVQPIEAFEYKRLSGANDML